VGSRARLVLSMAAPRSGAESEEEEREEASIGRGRVREEWRSVRGCSGCAKCERGEDARRWPQQQCGARRPCRVGACPLGPNVEHVVCIAVSNLESIFWASSSQIWAKVQLQSLLYT
jgi:hypothetical protein